MNFSSKNNINEIKTYQGQSSLIQDQFHSQKISHILMASSANRNSEDSRSLLLYSLYFKSMPLVSTKKSLNSATNFIFSQVESSEYLEN
jgi:hypothetical protein